MAGIGASAALIERPPADPRRTLAVRDPGPSAEDRLLVDLHPPRHLFEKMDLVVVDAAVSAHRDVQEEVASAIEEMIGMQVREVNVYIQDVA